MEISYSKNSKGIIKHLKTCKRYMDNKTHLKIYLGFQVKIDQNRFPTTRTLVIEQHSGTFVKHLWTFKT